MPKRRVIVDVNIAEEVEAFSRWLERWSATVDVSDDEGCGCCVNIWEITGPQAALDELPEAMIAETLP